MKKLLIPMALAAVLLASCGKTGTDSITITLWEDESNIEMVEELTKEYITNYKNNYPDAPELTIEIQSQTEKSAIEKMVTVSATGEGPDIASVTHDTIASGVSNKIIAPATYKHSLEERMTDEAMNAVTVDDEVYGYPITAESMTVMYDKTRISAADLASMDTLKASGKKLAWTFTGDDGGYYTWGLYTDSVLFGAYGKTASSVNIATEGTWNTVFDLPSSSDGLGVVSQTEIRFVDGDSNTIYDDTNVEFKTQTEADYSAVTFAGANKRVYINIMATNSATLEAAALKILDSTNTVLFTDDITGQDSFKKTYEVSEEGSYNYEIIGNIAGYPSKEYGFGNCTIADETGDFTLASGDTLTANSKYYGDEDGDKVQVVIQSTPVSMLTALRLVISYATTAGSTATIEDATIFDTLASTSYDKTSTLPTGERPDTVTVTLYGTNTYGEAAYYTATLYYIAS